MKLWIDDVHTAPENYLWCKSVNEAIDMIKYCETLQKYTFDRKMLELIDISYDSKMHTEITNWLKETGRDYEIKTHGGNLNG